MFSGDEALPGEKALREEAEDDEEDEDEEVAAWPWPELEPRCESVGVDDGTVGVRTGGFGCGGEIGGIAGTVTVTCGTVVGTGRVGGFGRSTPGASAAKKPNAPAPASATTSVFRRPRVILSSRTFVRSIWLRELRLPGTQRASHGKAA